MCSMHSSKIPTLCTQFYVVRSAGSVCREVQYSRKCGGHYIYLANAHILAFVKFYIWQIAVWAIHVIL